MIVMVLIIIIIRTSYEDYILIWKLNDNKIANKY